MKVSKILILTTNYGDGHLRASSSLVHQIKEANSDIEVEVVNLYAKSHPIMNKIIRNVYLKCYSTAPRVYGFIYYLTQPLSRNFYSNNIVGLFGKLTLKNYLKSYNPDLVINTFPVLAMPMLNKKRVTTIPCYTIVTDYGIHSQWIDPGVHKYYVGHEDVKEQMINWGIEKEKVEALGIPVCLECDENVKKEDVLQKHEIENKGLPLVTLLGGANGGMKNIDKMCPLLYNVNPKVQYIIVCGKNKELKERLEKAAAKYADRIKILGFVDNLHEIMKVSDIVITKPGGITTTEALNMNTPFIIYGNPAGQENENTKFFLKNGCSLHAKNIRQLVDIITRLIENPNLLSNIKENLSRVSNSKGCKGIIDSIIADFEKITVGSVANTDDSKEIFGNIKEIEC